MGQKVNPKGLRIGVIKDWDAKWYSDKNYVELLHEDLKLRKYLKDKLFASGVSNIVIERTGTTKVKINIFTAKPGIVIGRNGAGKTTTIKSMLNLVHPDSGEIFYFGKPLAENENEIKKLIGYSTGAVNWYPRKKLKDVVAVVKRCYDTWDEDAYRRYLALFALDENKTALEMSEGMRVKYNLLVALSHNARVLILDEPTSGLDPFSRDELLGLFAELKSHGVAVFFSTHIISDIEKCADDIVYISKGEIVAALPKAEFVSRFSKDGETIEETILRMERSGNNA